MYICRHTKRYSNIDCSVCACARRPPILWRAITQCFVSLAYSGVYLGEEGAQQLYATLNAMTRGRSGSGRRVHQRMSESVSESERVTQISEGEGDTLGHALLVALPYLGREVRV